MSTFENRGGRKAPVTSRGPDSMTQSHGAGRKVAGAVLAGAALAGAALLVRRAARQAERRHPPVGRFLRVDGVRVHYAEWGKGEPLVLLHGNGTMVHDWIVSGVAPALSERYRVIAIDRPGYGYTGRPRDRIWTPGAQADLVRGVLDHLGIEKPVVLGHSWGAIVALALGLDHPDRIRGLLLLSGYYFPTARPDVWAFAMPAIPVLGDIWRHTVGPLATRILAERVIGKSFEPYSVPTRFREGFPLGLALRPGQIRGSAEDSAIMVPAVAAMQHRYAALKVPTVVMSGDSDRVVTPERQSLRLHRTIPASQCTMLPGTGHMAQYFAHQQIEDAVGRLMGAPGAGAPADPHAPSGDARGRERDARVELEASPGG